MTRSVDLGGFTRFGFTVVGEKLEKDPAQQAIIKEVKVMRRRGMSLRRISKWVHRTHGVSMSHSTVSTFCKGKSHKPLSDKTVRNLLKLTGRAIQLARNVLHTPPEIMSAGSQLIPSLDIKANA